MNAKVGSPHVSADRKGSWKFEESNSFMCTHTSDGELKDRPHIDRQRRTSPGKVPVNWNWFLKNCGLWRWLSCSQNLRGILQLSVTPVSRDPMLFSGLLRHQAHNTHGTHAYIQANTHGHVNTEGRKFHGVLPLNKEPQATNDCWEKGN